MLPLYSFYFSIFLESAFSASIIPLSSDPTFFAMKAFGNYNMAVPFILAVIGASTGQSFNWLVGKYMLERKQKGGLAIDDYWYNRFTVLFNTYGIFLLLLSWVPLCNFLVVLAGFFGTKPKFVLPLVIIGQAMHYGWCLL